MKAEELIHELAAQGEPVERIEPPFVRLVRWALFAALSVGAGVALFGLRPDVGSALRSRAFLMLAVLTLALGVSSAFSALRMSVPGRTRLWLEAVPALVLALGTALLAHAFLSADVAHAGPGASCVGKILALALSPSVLLYLMLRKAAPLKVGSVGLLAALGALACGALGAQFICRNDDPLHIFVWHFVPMAVVGSVGIFAGRLALRWDER